MEHEHPDPSATPGTGIDPRWWALAAVVATLLAALGTWWYVTDPDVLSNQLGGLLITPAFCGVLWWLHHHLPLRVQWVGAFVLAIGGAVAYVAWPDANWWFFGSMLGAPLVGLIFWRGEQTDHDPTPWGGGSFDGPWGPP